MQSIVMYVLEAGRTDEERGAGNLQITGRDDQKDCLQYIYNMNGIMTEIDEEALGYAEEIAEYPWESAAWRWKIYPQTKNGCLDQYVVECAEKSDGHLILGQVLAAECFIHLKTHIGNLKMLVCWIKNNNWMNCSSRKNGKEKAR